MRLVVVAIVIALAALIASEWFARRAGMRYHGDEMLAVDVEKRLGEFVVAAKFETAGGVTALFGPRARARPRWST